MATSFQVTFDASDPGRLATFWAEVLGYKLQDPPEGFDTWDAFLSSMGIPEDQRNSASAIVDPDGKGARIFFQQVPEEKASKNRVHLDVSVTGGPASPLDERKQKVNAAAERLTGLGARLVGPKEKHGEYWAVMLDPEGNEFCVQ
jgi:hypothetical protein